MPNEARFLPGRLLAGRYRIIALLGRGGMGEVYRADDLTLGQPVALKFLPEEAAQNPNLLDRFKNEVRIARRVSHPNVCRVYDVGDIDGATFFTMEYVDGEDLSSLMRRIGRLPSDKALEIARQLCAGLAAAHNQHVLHRDLKPANIMLDGRGQVVITDFGLAGFAEQIQAGDIRSGTPAYMSPEQLEGKEVTERSDIYSLGLVLYEVFTGKRALSGDAATARTRTQMSSAPATPASIVRDIDPTVERVILRCLEANPTSRPASALQVAAALPGGDPLAAALAAGETPSPQMVAAAGETVGLSSRNAWLCLAFAIVGLLLISYVPVYTGATNQLGPDQPPAVLSQRARELTQQLGYTGIPADTAAGFSYDYNFQEYLQKNPKERPNWVEALTSAPGILQYWYRQSPRPLWAFDFRDATLTPSIVTIEDPPTIISNMVTVQMDDSGRLLMFQAIPPQREDAPAQASQVDWAPLFKAAGLDSSALQSAAPTWASLSASDVRSAWTGTWPGTNRPLRVEAAAFHGKVVFFSAIGPWTKANRMQEHQRTTSENIAQIIFLCLFIAIIGGGILLARRNYRQKRGDVNGAFRLATAMFVIQMLLWLCRGHFAATLTVVYHFILASCTSLFMAALAWTIYLALEPYIRRHWPHSIISWSRLLVGKFRDPIVGRDVLFGVILGVVWILLLQASTLLAQRIGAPPDTYSADFFMGTRQAIGSWLLHISSSIQGTLIFFFMLLLLRIVLRRAWLANVAFVFIWVVVKSLGQDQLLLTAVTVAFIYGLAALMLNRFGLVTLAVGIFVTDLLAGVPFNTDFSAWYAPNCLLMLASVIALAIWGFYQATTGQKLWNIDLLE
jgi:serine/threonine protein kinase